jgi:hypothetical protein
VRYLCGHGAESKNTGLAWWLHITSLLCGTTPGAGDLKPLAKLSKDGGRNFRLKCLLNYAMQPKFAKVEYVI